jgi:HNH endonuclease
MTKEERFMGHVDVVDGHWIWTGAVIPNNGYGKVRDPDSRRDMTAHRYSYQLFVGPIPEGVHVLHKHEGMKLCVNPEHLYLGDQVDNSAAYRQTAIRGFQILEKVRVRLEELRRDGSPESLVRMDELERLL